MKLTNYLRDSFVAAAMQDVPKVDFDEALRKEVEVVYLAACPKQVRELWKDASTRGFLEYNSVTYGGISVRVPRFYDNSVGRYAPNITADHMKQVQVLVDKKTAQDQQIDGLRSKLRAAAYACTTRKALAELLPEFEKYLPADEVSITKNLPAVANLVADFTKAGWPKGKKAVKAQAVPA